MSDASLGAALRGAVDLSSLRNRPAPHDAAAPAAPAGDGSAHANVVMDVTDQMFPQLMELSMSVPVVIDLWAEWCGPCKQLSPVIEKVTRDYGGRLLLAKVDVDQNPQIKQAFQVQSIPMVVAIVGQRPVPLFNGAVPEEQVRQVFDQLLQVAAQAGVTGSVPAGEPDGGADETAEQEPELPPLHQEAFDAIGRADYAGAIAAYEQALKQNPRDEEAQAGLGQVKLLERVQGLDLDEVRRAAADSPDDVEAQFAVADLDISGGHVDDALGRLLDLFARVAGDERKVVQERLVELFGLVGQSDPRVLKARARLSSLLF